MNKNGFFLVALSAFIAIGSVCCVAITSKAHKVSIREMRDRSVTESIRIAKEIGSNVKNSFKQNIAFCRNIIRHNAPKAKKKKRLPVKEKCVVATKEEDHPDMAVNKYYVNSYIKPIVFCLRSIENCLYFNNHTISSFTRNHHKRSELAMKAFFPDGKKG